jgi:phosphoribosylaminoimidazolecarboxamide formyltransferase/IMP cyclohydrolase
VARFYERICAEPGEMPQVWVNAYTKLQNLRYGENPHLRAALYASTEASSGLSRLEQLQGKELSYNNIQDLYAAFVLGRDLGPSSCAIIKHMNPCGAACCGSADESFIRAKRTDPASAFGSVVAFNAVVDARTAEVCGDIFLEVIVARGFLPEALTLFAKRKNLRLVAVPPSEWERIGSGFASREIGDLLLLQDRDEGFPELGEWKVMTTRKPSPGEEKGLVVGWKIAKHVRSNAIVICDGDGTVGVGAGQMSRVDSCRIAVDKGRREGFDLEGASAASDAFFPFSDGVEVLAEAGVKAIIQPGGSIRDEEVVAAANRLGIAMVFTGVRHFRH